MAKTKAIARRFPAIKKHNTCGVVKPFKIKEILSQQKTVNIKKNGQIIKATNLRRKPRCFPGRSRLIF